jgi:hypothetical protein
MAYHIRVAVKTLWNPCSSHDLGTYFRFLRMDVFSTGQAVSYHEATSPIMSSETGLHCGPKAKTTPA